MPSYHAAQGTSDVSRHTATPTHAQHLITQRSAPLSPITPQDKPADPAPSCPPEGCFPDKRPWAAVALDKAMDTADDVWRHARRQIAPLPTSSALIDRLVRKGGTEDRKPIILVLGSGEARWQVLAACGSVCRRRSCALIAARVALVSATTATSRGCLHVRVLLLPT